MRKSERTNKPYRAENKDRRNNYRSRDKDSQSIKESEHGFATDGKRHYGTRKTDESGAASKRSYGTRKPEEKRIYSGVRNKTHKQKFTREEPEKRRIYTAPRTSWAEKDIHSDLPQNTAHNGDENWIETLQLEGRKAVLEALNHDKAIDRILLKKEADGTLNGTLKLIAAKAKEAGIVTQAVERAKLDAITQSGNHQGVIAVCPAKEYVEISDILAIAAEKNEPPFVLILDGITDPHNLGAILRTADAAGVHGVIIPKRRAVGLTGAVAKTSAGAVNHVAVARVTNIVRTIEELKEAGLWIVCAQMDAPVVYDADLTGPIALIVGAEGEGVSRLAEEKSDFAVSIPMRGKIEALNASVAAGILLYEVLRGRIGKNG